MVMNILKERLKETKGKLEKQRKYKRDLSRNGYIQASTDELRERYVNVVRRRGSAKANTVQENKKGEYNKRYKYLKTGMLR